jgi:7-keto-8-aminopelargonate synthetase-like enzyme
VIEILRVRANSYIFSSSLPPEQACGIMASLKIMQAKPELRDRLWRNVHHLRAGLQEIGFDILNSETHIIPIFIGDEGKSTQMSRLLFERGILAPAIKYPAVPVGKSRIRCTVMATHTRPQIEWALSIFEEAGEKTGVIGRSMTQRREVAYAD